MVHGKSQFEVDQQIEQIAVLLGNFNLENDVLFSTRILKKKQDFAVKIIIDSNLQHDFPISHHRINSSTRL